MTTRTLVFKTQDIGTKLTFLTVEVPARAENCRPFLTHMSRNLAMTGTGGRELLRRSSWKDRRHERGQTSNPSREVPV